jgi:glucosamine-6-phosphate deaminase
MNIIVTENYEEISQKANEIMRGVVQGNPNAVLGLATGSSPIGLYKLMKEDCAAGVTSYKNIKTVNLDEYVGLPKENDQSYYYFMHENLFGGLDIDEKNVNLPSGEAEPKAECERYTKLLQNMPQDIQILGIGGNGHIGFNEPGTSFDSTTHIIQLKEKTRLDNARFFKSLEEVPTHAITMGIKNILDAKKIVVIASGAGKAEAVFAMLNKPADINCPASALQTHKDVTVILDKEAAKLL